MSNNKSSQDLSTIINSLIDTSNKEYLEFMFQNYYLIRSCKKARKSTSTDFKYSEKDFYIEMLEDLKKMAELRTKNRLFDKEQLLLAIDWLNDGTHYDGQWIYAYSKIIEYNNYVESNWKNGIGIILLVSLDELETEHFAEVIKHSISYYANCKFFFEYMNSEEYNNRIGLLFVKCESIK